MREDEQQIPLPDVLGEAEPRRPTVSTRHRINVALGLSNIPRGVSGVYFLLSHDRLYVKIGKSHKPRQRIKDIRRMNPHELEVLLVVPGYTAVESWFHSHFTTLRTHYEWFRYEGPLVEMVELLRSGERTLYDINPIIVEHDRREIELRRGAMSNTTSDDEEDLDR